MATSSITLRACHGLPPYSWSKIGNVTLSSDTGTQIQVSTNSLQSSGVSGVSCYKAGISYAYRACAGDCSGKPLFVDAVLGILLEGYNCSGSLVETISATSGLHPIGESPYSNITFTLDPPDDGCTNESENLTFPPSAVFYSACCDAASTFGVSLNVTPAGANGRNGTIHAGAAAYSGNEDGFATNLEDCEALSDATFHAIGGFIDVRTQAMVDAGCINQCEGCADPDGAIVTVTDAAGVSVTYEIE